jgi:Asp/Glu/hydantoin racemase
VSWPNSTNISTQAAVIIAAVSQPSVLSVRELTRCPITWGSLVSSVTSTISGGAGKPLRTADQNSILIALYPSEFNSRPRITPTPRTV